MNVPIEYLSNKATVGQIAEHLLSCDADFLPPLSGRIEIEDYAQKIVSKAMRLEAWSGVTMVGLLAVYCNDKERRIAYITNVSLLRAWMGRGIATQLINQCVEYVKACGMWQINLEVANENTAAIKLYKKNGFIVGKVNEPFVGMSLYLKGREEHEQQT